MRKKTPMNGSRSYVARKGYQGSLKRPADAKPPRQPSGDVPAKEKAAASK